MKAVAFYNNKGGVGKTTLSTQMAIFCGEYQKMLGSKLRVLFIDLDEQMNGTQFMTEITPMQKYMKESVNNDLSQYYPYSIADVVCDESFPVEKAIVQTMFDNVDMIPGNQNMKEIALNIHTPTNSYGHLILNHQIRKLEDTYEYVFIDCPPAKTTGETALGLFLADAVIIPILADPYSLYSLSTCYQMIENVEKSCYTYTKHNLMNLGIVFNQFQRNAVIDKHFLENFLKNNTFPFSGIIIRKAVKVSQDTYFHSPVINIKNWREGKYEEGEAMDVSRDFYNLAYYILSSLKKGKPNNGKSVQ